MVIKILTTLNTLYIGKVIFLLMYEVFIYAPMKGIPPCRHVHHKKSTVKRFAGKEKNKVQTDNPFHTEYGIISNIHFILGEIKQYSPALLLIMILGVITNSMMGYLWSFIGKYVIDLIQIQAENSSRDIAPLLHLVIFMTLIELVCLLVGSADNNRIWYNMIYARMRTASERVAKSLFVNYQTLEQPKILDMHNKALVATSGNEQGIEGMMHVVYDFGIQLLTMTVTVCAEPYWTGA